jgi:beta-lactamase superfamily II metal-dependent hydrolase
MFSSLLRNKDYQLLFPLFTQYAFMVSFYYYRLCLHYLYCLDSKDIEGNGLRSMSTLRVICWDVEHGNAAYIKTPFDKHIALDLGNSSSFSPLQFLKESFNVQKLDEVIITHPHADHISDISNFDSLSPRVLSRPKHLTEEEIRKANRTEDKAVIDKYMEIHNRYTVPVKKEANPELAENNGGVSFHTFKDTSTSKNNINNHGLITIVEYMSCKILFPGDIEPAAWLSLLKNQGFISAISEVDILIASHHGRESGFCSDIYQHFTPKLTVISDGRFVDTSATSRYSEKSSGWTIHHRDNSKASEKRNCITTRNDGHIDIEIGKNGNGKTYISVTVD